MSDKAVSEKPTSTTPATGVSRRNFLLGAAAVVGGLALTREGWVLAQQFWGPGGLDLEAAKAAGYTVRHTDYAMVVQTRGA